MSSLQAGTRDVPVFHLVVGIRECQTYVECWDCRVDIVHIIAGIQDQNAVAREGETGCERPATGARSHHNVVIFRGRVGISSRRHRLVLPTVEFLVSVLVSSVCQRPVLANLA